MRKNKFTNVLIVEDKNQQKQTLDQSPNKILINQTFHHNKIYFPIGQQQKLLPYKLTQKIDLHKKDKTNSKKLVNDQNKTKIKQRKNEQQNKRKKSFNRHKKFVDFFHEGVKQAKNCQISRNTIMFRRPSKIVVTTSGNHIYRSKNIKSLKHIDMKSHATFTSEKQYSKEIVRDTKDENSIQNLKKIKSQINSSLMSPKINKDYSAYLPSKKYSRSKLYSTRNSPQKINIGSQDDWICQKLIRQQVYGFQIQEA